MKLHLVAIAFNLARLWLLANDMPTPQSVVEYFYLEVPKVVMTLTSHSIF
ncbi:MAG: hypothetical protein V7L23_14765 [Nostoc sp.]